MKTLFLLPLLIISISAQEWYKNFKGIQVQNLDEFEYMVSEDDADYADKHIVLNFFMEHCHWCQQFQSAWNQLQQKHADERDDVVYLYINGPENRELMEKYRVNGFPTIMYLRAKSKGMDASEFDEGRRTFDSFNKWVEHAVKWGNKKNLKIQKKKERAAANEKVEVADDEKVPSSGNAKVKASQKNFEIDKNNSISDQEFLSQENYTQLNFNEDLKSELKNLNIKQLLHKNKIIETHHDFEELSENLNLELISKKHKKVQALVKEKLGSSQNVFKHLTYLLGGFIIGFSSVVLVLMNSQKQTGQSQKQDTGGSADTRIGESDSAVSHRGVKSNDNTMEF